MYISTPTSKKVTVWRERSTTPSREISLGLNSPTSLFVTTIDDVYVTNYYDKYTFPVLSSPGHYRVDKNPWNTESTAPVLNVTNDCTRLFVDINNTLYCSMKDKHQVVKRSLNDYAATLVIAAGTGTAGQGSNMLRNPHGIFVDMNLTLYVADCANNRIQRFESGQSKGTTTVGTGAPETITLSCPTAIVIDGDGYLFIVDRGNHRVVRSGQHGFRCVIGCSGIGSIFNAFFQPQTMAFDNYGNIFIIDGTNGITGMHFSIKKFLLASNSCGKCNNILFQKNINRNKLVFIGMKNF
jgi:sugar lactone lactonase YvrE